MSDINNNEPVVTGTDLFADSENFLNELTDSDLDQVVIGANNQPSNISLLLCDFLPV